MSEEELRALREKVEEAHKVCVREERKILLEYGTGASTYVQAQGEAYWNVLKWLDEIENARR